MILVYVATHIAMTVYILEGFFAQIPQDLFDAARMDGYSDFEIFWRVTMPIGAPAIFTTVTLNFIILWNEFLFAVILLTDDDKRTFRWGSCISPAVTSSTSNGVGLMIAIVPIVAIYAFSETMIKGMTAGLSVGQFEPAQRCKYGGHNGRQSVKRYAARSRFTT